jgi:hypothetical protein
MLLSIYFIWHLAPTRGKTRPSYTPKSRTKWRNHYGMVNTLTRGIEQIAHLAASLTYSTFIACINNVAKTKGARRSHGTYIRPKTVRFKRLTKGIKKTSDRRLTHRVKITKWIAMNTQSEVMGKADKVHFYTDSFEIKVDTGCSLSMSGTKKDFMSGILKPAPPNMDVGAYGGAQIPVSRLGTLRWMVTDDDG